jgi:hypothetical protein
LPINSRFLNLHRRSCHICEKLTERVGQELNIPAYLYEYVA